MTVADLSAPVIGFVREHHAWAPYVCCALAFCESLAFISLLVPATVMLIGIGGLVPLADLPFFGLAAGAAVGAALGDWLSFWIGWRFRDRIGGIWPFTRYPEMLPRGQRFFDRWGAFGVFLGRFLGPLRATVPIVAGACAMPALPFQLANWTSAAVWAVALLAPGALGVTWLERFFG